MVLQKTSWIQNKNQGSYWEWSGLNQHGQWWWSPLWKIEFGKKKMHFKGTNKSTAVLTDSDTRRSSTFQLRLRVLSVREHVTKWECNTFLSVLKTSISISEKYCLGSDNFETIRGTLHFIFWKDTPWYLSSLNNVHSTISLAPDVYNRFRIKYLKEIIFIYFCYNFALVFD